MKKNQQISFVKVMHKTFDEFPLDEVNKVCDEHGALEGFKILAKRLTKERRQEIVDKIIGEEHVNTKRSN
jgi:hypothetical protein